MQRGETGNGYVYYRDRARGTDTTVYEHQLVALLDHPADVVFADDVDIHHRNRCKLDNRPANLEPVNQSVHRRRHARAEP